MSVVLKNAAELQTSYVSQIRGTDLLWPFPFLAKRQWLAGTALFLAYLIAAQAGVYLHTAPAIILPSAGIALGALLLEGIALWPAVTAALIVNYLMVGVSPISLVLLTLGNTLTPVVATYFLHRLGFSNYLRRLRDILLFFCVVPIASAITPILGMFALYLNTTLLHAPVSNVTGGAWWVGIITSNFIFALFIARWGVKPTFTRTRQELIEFSIAFAGLVVCSVLLYWTPYSSLYGISFVYILLIPLFWIALRSGPRFLSLMLVVFTTIGIAGLFWGPVPLSTSVPLGERLFQNEIFLDILAIIFYIVVAIEEERKEALRIVSGQIVKLEEVLGEIEGESRAKTDFLAMLAHELRNPLAPVASSIELLRVRNQVTEEGLPVLDVMEGSIKVIKRLLDDLLDMSRITQKKITLQKEPFHIGFVARRAIKNLEKRFEDQSQTILLDLPKIPLMVEADPVRIEQVITNLLGNASKFTPRGGTISLVVKQQNGMAEIHIKDSGIGIDPSMLGKIFEPFVQVERGHQGQEGLGIGLALTQTLVEVHGGSVEAKSEGRGKGSEFVVRLPLTYTTRIQEKGMGMVPTGHREPELSRTILVVDDNVPAARAIGALLQHDGHRVDFAASGAETKEKLSTMEPNVVIMDIGLPDTNGYDVARALRREYGYKGLLIALTGHGLEEDKKRATESGFDIHLTKPISMKDLRETLLP
jgi:signal transduction histidine kinase